MARKPTELSDFPLGTRRRHVAEEELFTAEDLARFEALRTDTGDVIVDDGPPEGDRWSIWDESEPLQRGPRPFPEWVITDSGAVDYELGVLKTGKEADVVLLERTVPGDGRTSLLASKRYRSAEHMMFHRSADYTASRTTRKSRDRRALNRKSTFGREVASMEWATAEFNALKAFCEAGVPVPYPVQIVGREVIMEFIGAGRSAAPRLAEMRPDADQLEDLWDQAYDAVLRIAELGYTHGDLSAYNIVVHDGRLVVIDLPQIVDLYMNPQGTDFLVRDVENLGAWFEQRGLGRSAVDDLLADVLAIVAP